MDQRRVLIISTSHATKGSTGQKTGAYLPEISHPVDAFTAAGLAVDFASVRGGAVPLDGIDNPDDSAARFLADAAQVQRLHSGPSLAEVAARIERGELAYDAIFLAGGHGTMWDFPGDASLAALVGRFVDEGKVVGAVCHGPAGLVNARTRDGRPVVAGKTVAAFTNEEEAAVGLTKVVPFLLQDALASQGATVKTAGKWEKNVVVDGRLVTGQNPASAGGVAEAMVGLLQ